MEAEFLDGCEHLLICYGTVSRTAIEAVVEARAESGLELGYIRLVTLWPFPEERLRQIVHDVDTVFIPEMNLGMMKHPITQALRDRCRKIVPIPSIGTLHTPDYILARIHEETAR
jgi:2-oxoglutarate ferredoxin oxidoreductase subunit alpha